MKEHIKKIIPAFILGFIISFMINIYEPITLFVSNRDEFNFNLINIQTPMLLEFILLIIRLYLFYILIYIINRIITKNNDYFYYITLIITYISFIMLYIQGNLLISNLPQIDGKVIDWSNYYKEDIITLIIFILLIGIYIYCIKKYKFEKVIKASTYISLIIFAMLSVALIPSLFNKELYSNKKVLFISKKNINNISKNKNFMILVIDAADSRTFNDELQKSEYKNLFEDFTYYPDTLSMYPFTENAIPHLLTGKANHNEMKYTEYYNKAMNESLLIDKLIEDKYQINIYNTDIRWYSNKSSNVANIESFDKSFNRKCYQVEQSQYIAYKYLPYFLKHIPQMDEYLLNFCKTIGVKDAYTYNNKVYDNILKQDPNLIDDNYFSFVHISGAHLPYNLDKDLNEIENGTYQKQIQATLTITNDFINRLKESNQYDNTAIIIMADHGENKDDIIELRTNPILYIKGIDEHHPMETSNKAISYDDLMDAYLQLLNGQQSTELFENITEERERTFITYPTFKDDKNLTEMKTTGKAWELDKMKKTGRVFKLK